MLINILKSFGVIHSFLRILRMNDFAKVCDCILLFILCSYRCFLVTTSKHIWDIFSFYYFYYYVIPIYQYFPPRPLTFPLIFILNSR